MTTAASIYPLAGTRYAGNANNTTDGGISVELSTGTGYVPLIPLGTIITVNDPYWGTQELIRLQAPASTVANVGTVWTYDANWLAAAVAVSTNLNQPCAVAMSYTPSTATAQYVWAIIGGRAPVLASAAFASGAPAYISATAGKIFTTATTGREIGTMRSVAAATATVAKANTTTVNGSAVLKVSNTNGWFVGVALSGTGIPTATIIAIDPDDRTVTMSANATASGSVTVTGTYNDSTLFWPTCIFSRPALVNNP